METLWKEWRQQRGAVLLGICAGILWPLLELAINYSDRQVWFTNFGSGIVAGGGAVFAILLAMATGCADLRPGIDTFWQARPVRVGRVFFVKLLVGVSLLTLAFALVMVPDLWSGLHGGTATNGVVWFAWTSFSTTWPRAILLFGAGLFFVALIRDTAKAAFVTIGFGLGVYFLPLFFNALAPWSVFERFDTPYQDREFISGLSATLRTAWSQGIVLFMHVLGYLLLRIDWIPLGIGLGGAMAFTLLAVRAVKRNWRWQPGQKTIVWTLGASAALIFAVTLFQVRVDLRPVTHKDGHTLINPMPLDWVEPPLPQAVKDRGNRLLRSSFAGQVSQGGYLYALNLAYESHEDLAYEEWNRPVHRHVVLQVYRFPLGQDSSRLGCGGLVIGSMTEMSARGMALPVDSYIRGDRLYVAYPDQPRADGPKTCLATLEITNPEQPRLISTLEIEGTGRLVGCGDQAYILGSNQRTVLSLRQPDQPSVAAQWTYNTRGRRGVQPQLPMRLSEPNSVYLPCSFRCQIVGSRILCTDGHALAMLDVSEPNDPVLVYYEDCTETEQLKGNTSIAAIAMDQDCLYVSTQRGLIVRRLIRHIDGHWSSERVGYRAATPLERLSGRNVSQLLLHDGHLIESARDFGLLVYDISNPARPRRVMHSDVYSVGMFGIWEGLLYSQGYADRLNLFDLPARTR